MIAGEGIRTYQSLGTSARVTCKEAKEKYPDYLCIALSRDVYGNQMYVAFGDDMAVLMELCGARRVGFGERNAEIEPERIQQCVQELVTKHGLKVMVIWGYAFYRPQAEKEPAT